MATAFAKAQPKIPDDSWKSDHRGESILFGGSDHQTGASSMAAGGKTIPIAPSDNSSWEAQVKHVEDLAKELDRKVEARAICQQDMARRLSEIMEKYKTDVPRTN
ncbi:hypothetical protein HDV05_001735 [Chytridiales sp. JEL 0842]|nr:hypothetical protein HDV05_001735 [Chytridiales sp. JEL 0842]